MTDLTKLQAAMHSGDEEAAREALFRVDRVFRATCITCGYSVTRAKRESAEHVMAQHVTYTHGAA